MGPPADPLARFQPAVRDWFLATFPAPTPPQALGWPVLARRESTLLLAPTGTGKTLAAFLACIDRLMFEPLPPRAQRCRVLYVSPLKALAVDVERNLRAPLLGIANVAAARGDPHLLPAIAVRTGDTPPADRARFRREPADILITTPESLYLLLTSRAREALRSVDTVIVDEIHALVPTKRGAHLMLSLERLEALTGRPLQRIGLSATQHPLDEVARFLGGAALAAPGRGQEVAAPLAEAPLAVAELDAEFARPADGVPALRPVTIVDAGAPKALALRIEVPVEDMARLDVGAPASPESSLRGRTSLWTAIHPRLLELVRSHTSTLLFVNSRRVAERLAAALNELAGETLVRAHHGSLARGQRLEVEEALKAGQLRALVATSSLELGIDMGAVDLVIQIAAPPSVAAGLQRIGRAGHRIGEPSTGVVFPRYRADLLACAALTRAMHEGRVEPIRYPRNPLDVLAQQVVAMAATEAWPVDALYARIRCAAPFAELSRATFDGVLDMLAGRYASEAFAGLRPRLTWDRVAGTVTGREGSQRLAIANGGTIPDRGLYGVFLAEGERRQARVGELDEEMVFESKVGDVFLLGASSWRIEEITHDRVLVSPAPGQPGRMPFWRGEAPGRPLETGRAIGRLLRELRAEARPAALARLVEAHDLDPRAADNLLRYLDDQAAATGDVPDDRTLLLERTRDEMGDWRICLLSPLGGRVHAPWSMAIVAGVRDALGVEAETTWTDDGIVVRLPETESPPDPSLFLPGPHQVEALVLGQLGSTPLFAARFREIAARALLLPRRRPGSRTPLWQQRKRASDLLAVASRFGSFPMLLEAYRECLRDVFDLPALTSVLAAVEDGSLRVRTVDTRLPSPFAASLLFGFVANFLYDGDAPLAERRAQALTVDQAQLRELLGESELRELLDAGVMAEVEAELQHLAPPALARTPDAVHDLLLRLGDLTREELAARCLPEAADAVDALVAARRVVAVRMGGEPRLVAVEDAVRVRDGLGVELFSELPEALLVPVREPLLELVARYARSHTPFTAPAVARRLGVPGEVAAAALRTLVARGRLLEGAFRPGGTEREWCTPEVLATLRRRSLARLRHAVEPVEPAVLGRLVAHWQRITRRRSGLDAVLDAVEQLQGCPVPASVLESDILPARVEGYRPADLDALAAAGEVAWVGVEPLGERDGRIALYLTDQLPRLVRPPPAGSRVDREPLGERELAMLEHLRGSGASFFGPLHQAAGGGFPRSTREALWHLVFEGLVSNDGFAALRAFLAPPEDRRRRRGERTRAAFRSRRSAPPGTEGRWSLVQARLDAAVSSTAWSAATAEQLLARYGLVTREVAQTEQLAGGFAAVGTVLHALEEAGRIRRGYFVAGVGASQFVLPEVLDLLRSLRAPAERPEVVRLAATDPANPYGTLLRWPEQAGEVPARPARAVGAQVVLVDGALAAWLGRGGRQGWVWLPEGEPDRSRVARAVAAAWAELAKAARTDRHGGLLITELDGRAAAEHPLALFLAEAGFVVSSLGLHLRRPRPEPADLFSGRGN
ncbi:MAG TPA: DEAD/DEAH box helicase [Myxococcaceae bacterium]|nr:DEAD/DEAH box helicase [Myxococcaceae bacterium]